MIQTNQQSNSFNPQTMYLYLLIYILYQLHEKPKDDLVIPLVDNTLEVNYRNLHPELSFDNSSQNNTNDSAPVAIDESKPMVYVVKLLFYFNRQLKKELDIT